MFLCNPNSTSYAFYSVISERLIKIIILIKKKHTKLYILEKKAADILAINWVIEVSG